ncbi:hypothetical protein DAD186_05310 [Dermabacter vaginalis]|uniref:Uncharacterized protein n=1 Tax=Dermabacter vaginalis TaxID=1630135 RepID=A0A1B0ZGM6_9MICO|nr:hypothetical protein DAD186_05310 [Dermabacter vaginalis]
MATTAVTRGHATLVVTATRLGQGADQRLLRLTTSDLDEVGDARTATARRGRLVLTNSHRGFPQTLSFVFGSRPLRRSRLRRCRWIRP